MKNPGVKLPKNKRVVVIIVGILLLLFLPSLLAFLYMFAETGRVVFERRDLPVKNLPAAWQGKKLIQISDVHFSRYTDKSFIKRVFKGINAENPEIIVLTGDCLSNSFQNYSDNFLAEMLKNLKELTPKLKMTGKIAVLGNHDYEVFGPLEGNLGQLEIKQRDFVVSFLREAGFVVLQNGIAEVGDKEKLYIAGLGDVWANQARPKDILEDRSLSDLPVIVLVHNPDIFPEIAALGDFTVLSGHTHGGQVIFPHKYDILKRNIKYLGGFYREKGAVLYVNRGLGVVNLPIRLGSPPEVTVFTLVGMPRS